MLKEDRYGIKSLHRDFPTDEACLEFIFNALHSKTCSCGGIYRLISGRRQFQCSQCRFQIAPTANTIFHKSETPLTTWFSAILIFSNAKSGISANELARQLELYYKTAWRILYLIRKALTQDTDKLSGDVEMDGAYFGGRRYGGKDNKGSKALKAKSAVMAAVERGGDIKAEVVSDMTADSHWGFIQKNISQTNTRLLTDKSNRYDNAASGYKRESVDHGRKEYVRGDVHVNRIETFWSHVKRSIAGTHKIISKEYFQTYLDGFVFHYNNRHSDKERFSALLGILLHA